MMTIAEINKKIESTKPLSRDALQLKRSWQAWYKGLSWFELNSDAKVQAIALDRFHAFQSVNGVQFGAEEFGYRTIKLGLSGNDVKHWQKILKIPQTGEFDSATESATKSWQSAHGLKPDGKVGPNTWALAPKSTGSIIRSNLSKFKNAFIISGALIFGGGVAWFTERGKDGS